MGIREFLDKIEHNFEKGGKHEKWYALYEAIDTFFYRPGSVTKTTAHVRDGLDLKRMMITVWLCTFPVIFYGMYNIGFQANTIYAGNPDLLAAQDNWRLALIALVAGFQHVDREVARAFGNEFTVGRHFTGQIDGVGLFVRGHLGESRLSGEGNGSSGTCKEDLFHIVFLFGS